jgi:hypothetical protein
MQLKIKPVDGIKLPDPRTQAVRRDFLGYKRGEPRERTVLGRKVMVPSYVRDESVDELIVAETRDGYFRRAILAGDVDYVGHMDGSKDLALVRATAKNRMLRDAAAEAARKAEQIAADAFADELEAAERGED